MLFKINDKKEEVIDCLVDNNLYFGIYTLEEFKNVYELFFIDSCLIKKYENRDNLRFNTVVFKNEYLSATINLFDNRGFFTKKDSFLFFVSENTFLIVVLSQEHNKIYDVFCDVYKQIDAKSISIDILVYLFFCQLIVDDYKYIDDILEELNDIEKYNNREESAIFIGKIKKINKELVLLRHYYEDLMSIGEEMQIGYYSLFGKENIRYMEIFVHRISRLLDDVSLLQETAIQLRDIHQSQLDYSMNKTMEFFTVITSIFMPLTLITGWYGMNFQYMPEIEFKYSYYVVIGVCISIVLLCVYWFKKKKYF